MRGLSLCLALTLFACGASPAVQVHGGEAAAAATFEGTFLVDRLYFGRSIHDGRTVSDTEWDRFLAEIVSPRLPKGFTVWRAQGQWQNERHVVEREDSFVLECVHAREVSFDAQLRAIAAEYKKRFQQESVLRVTQPARVSF